MCRTDWFHFWLHTNLYLMTSDGYLFSILRTNSCLSWLNTARGHRPGLRVPCPCGTRLSPGTSHTGTHEHFSICFICMFFKNEEDKHEASIFGPLPYMVGRTWGLIPEFFTFGTFKLLISEENVKIWRSPVKSKRPRKKQKLWLLEPLAAKQLMSPSLESPPKLFSCCLGEEGKKQIQIPGGGAGGLKESEKECVGKSLQIISPPPPPREGT